MILHNRGLHLGLLVRVWNLWLRVLTWILEGCRWLLWWVVAHNQRGWIWHKVRIRSDWRESLVITENILFLLFLLVLIEMSCLAVLLIFLLLIFDLLLLFFLSLGVSSWRFLSILETLKDSTCFKPAVLSSFCPLRFHRPKHWKNLNKISASLEIQCMLLSDLRYRPFLLINLSENAKNEIFNFRMMILFRCRG